MIPGKYLFCQSLSIWGFVNSWDNQSIFQWESWYRVLSSDSSTSYPIHLKKKPVGFTEVPEQKAYKYRGRLSKKWDPGQNTMAGFPFIHLDLTWSPSRYSLDLRKCESVLTQFCSNSHKNSPIMPVMVFERGRKKWLPGVGYGWGLWLGIWLEVMGYGRG